MTGGLAQRPVRAFRLRLSCGHGVSGEAVVLDPARLVGAQTACGRCGAMRVIERVVLEVTEQGGAAAGR